MNECCRAIPNEYVEGISIELRDDNDGDCKQAVNPFTQPIINPESLDIWKPGHIRLFISHRDEHKKKASELAAALEGYGVSSFVAHDTIEPMEKWQSVIQKAMLSAEIMLAFITDDFFDSCWTNQEIGFALGRGIPVVSLRMQKTAPRGFINEVQAMPADLEAPEDAVEGLYKILAEKLGQEERLRRATLQAFLSSNDWGETEKRFKRLKTLDTLTDADIQKIIDAFPKNEALYKCWYLTHPKNNRLLSFLENRTGKKYVVENNHIKLDLSQEDMDIPF